MEQYKIVMLAFVLALEIPAIIVLTVGWVRACRNVNVPRYEYLVLAHSPVRDSVFLVFPTHWKAWRWMLCNLRKFDYVSITKEVTAGGTAKND